MTEYMGPLVSCQGKHKYRNFRHIKQAIQTMSRHPSTRGDAKNIEAYKCRHCNGWHIGSRDRRPLKKEARVKRVPLIEEEDDQINCP